MIQDDNTNNDNPEIEDKRSAEHEKKMRIKIAIFIIICTVGIIVFFFSDDKKNKSDKNKTSKIEEVEQIIAESKPVTADYDERIILPPDQEQMLPLIVPNEAPQISNNITTNTLDIPLPEIEETIAPPSIEIDRPNISPPSTQTPTFRPREMETMPMPLPGEDLLENSETSNAKRKSSMIAFGGGAPDTREGGGDKEEGEDGKKILKKITDKQPIGSTSAQQVAVTKYGTTNTMITQGKIIEAILETAVNTNLPGLIRGIVSKNVYSDGGNNILIPRGTKLIGKYSAEASFQNNRIDIAWTRMILANGIDINVENKGVDNLGRTGVSGNINTKFLETLQHALLITSIPLGLNFIGETGSISTSTDKDGKTTTTGTSKDLAIKQATDNLNTTLKTYADKIKPDKPTITIDQGTKILIFVNKDIIFPKSHANLNVIISAK